MLKLLQRQKGVDHVTKQDLLACESRILIVWDFNVRIVSSIPFLERFERIFDIGNHDQNELQMEIRKLARRFCLFSLRDPLILDSRPSLITAACLLIAINLTQSPIAEAVGIKRYDES